MECFTASGGPCFTIDSLGVTSVVTTSGGSAFDTNDHMSSLTVSGNGFVSGATATLERAGSPTSSPVL